MIIKRIAALCKAAKNIILLDCDDGTQWVGDGRGFYQLVGMPELGEQSICAVIFISAGKSGGNEDHPEEDAGSLRPGEGGRRERVPGI